MTDRLTHYLKLWNLSALELLAQTPTSTVYTVHRAGETAVLKVLTSVGAEDEYGGAAALRHFNGHGAVRLLACDYGAHLLEYAEGEELAQMVVRGDDLPAAAIIADVLNRLHRPQPAAPVPQVQTLRRRFRSLFQTAVRDAAVGITSIYVRGARAAEYLLGQPQDECVLHGDIHHHNIRLHPRRGWLAFDPKGLYGERSYDAANTLCNPANARDRVMSEERLLQVSQVLADGMGVDVGRLRTFVFAHACLSASWPDKPDGSDVQDWFLTVARNAERHASFPA